MPVRQEEEDADPVADPPASRVRQWRRAALALAFLFASLPVAGKLFLDSWRFDGALQIAFLCLMAAGYLYFVGRDNRPPVPDSSVLLDEALGLAASAATGRALGLLDSALRLNPDLWQAWQYRGQIRLAEVNGAGSAIDDFTKAIRLAPGEAHLYRLRSLAFSLLGRDSDAQADLETAARLGGDEETAVES